MSYTFAAQCHSLDRAGVMMSGEKTEMISSDKLFFVLASLRHMS